MQAVKEDRPSYVRFEKRAVEDRALSITNGQYTTVDVDFAIITPHGTSDEIPRVVKDWFSYLTEQVRGNRVPAKFFEYYQECYARWLKGEEAPLTGTPLKEWPPLSPAERENLMRIRIYTVEDLANANEDSIRQIGMGARALQQKAENWLRSATDQGKMAEEMSSLQVENKRLSATVGRQEKALDALRSEVEGLLQQRVLPSPIAESAVHDQEGVDP